jgi:hypothetical protein
MLLTGAVKVWANPADAESSRHSATGKARKNGFIFGFVQEGIMAFARRLAIAV